MKMRAWEMVVSAILLLVLAAILLPALARVRTGVSHSCASNMKQLGLSMRMYANESEGNRYPSLSSEPGRLMWKIAPMYPEYSPDPIGYLCPSDEDFNALTQLIANDEWRRIELKPGIKPEDIINDWSYIYLGYLLLSDDDVEYFAENYKQRESTRQNMDEDLALPDVKDVTVSKLMNDDPTVPTIIKDAPIRHDTLYRLRDGVAAKLFEQVSDYEVFSDTSRGWPNSNIPILIDRPGSHVPEGANVLYLDGSIEFIPYPGKWPMTEKTIAILNELDAMGEDK